MRLIWAETYKGFINFKNCFTPWDLFFIHTSIKLMWLHVDFRGGQVPVLESNLPHPSLALTLKMAGNCFLWNVGTCLPDYMASHPRTLQSSYSWKPHSSTDCICL
jgi:hypothetical protein